MAEKFTFCSRALSKNPGMQINSPNIQAVPSDNKTLGGENGEGEEAEGSATESRHVNMGGEPGESLSRDDGRWLGEL